MEQRSIFSTDEYYRLMNNGDAWKRWGPYLSERAWGTVREDYSPDGNAWEYLSHDASRSRAYRWNEDGLAGISDDKGQLCFSIALWNGHDPILKERLFGLTGHQGNHGEDVKELYYYLDSTPTHSYMRMLYKYPQIAFPYQQLIDENRRRGRNEPEFELSETGIFADNRYFDVFVEYAKSAPDDILIRIRAINRGPEHAILYMIPTIWFRNTWSWNNTTECPLLRYAEVDAQNGFDKTGEDSELSKTCVLIKAQHTILGDYQLFCETNTPDDDVLFTNNDTNVQLLFGAPNATPYVKDAFHEYLLRGNSLAVNPARVGTKACVLGRRTIASGASFSWRLRLTKVIGSNDKGRNFVNPFDDYESTFKLRMQEADEFYTALQPPHLNADQRRIHRQSLAGMLWNKQFYHYIVEKWLQGDPAQPPPPTQRKYGRNHEWRHLYNERVMSMPDKWEYPWYASWDLAFHCIPFALIDSDFAKSQLDLLMREWYMHPNGQIPAYEWAFGDVNPPVFAWAAWRVYKIDQEKTGCADHMFLERIFHKLLLNFTWWVNRKDSEGKNVFQGGFLGLDNIGAFDRSAPLPTGGFIEQSDGTSWMGMFSLNMMTIALELALSNPVYEDIALKFFEHFLAIAAAMNNIADEGIRLWDEEDEFFYDVLHLPDDTYHPIKIRSLVGLIPLCAVEVLEPHVLDALPTFKYHLTWFLNYRPDLMRLVSHWQQPEAGERRLLALVRGHNMKRLLKRMLDSTEFLSNFGIRSLSKFHAMHPFELPVDGITYRVQYEPAESYSDLFGGNSNWRGPIWFPLNFLLIESLQKFYYYYGDDFKVECPTNSGQYLNLKEIADELSQRLVRLFLRDQTGRRPCQGDCELLQRDPHFRDYLLFHEFFHGDNGKGLGADHQTGWTGLVAMLLQQAGTQSVDDPRGISSFGHRQTVPLVYEPFERS
jgi:Mannosylglycerate hydrolase MGH1-like glycoside hydrolase domain/Glycosyl hydrolase family 63 C-terminal domain